MPISASRRSAVGIDDLLRSVAKAAVGIGKAKGSPLLVVRDRAPETHHRDIEPGRIEALGVGRLAQQTHRAVADAEDLPAIGRRGAQRDGADHGVQSAATPPLVNRPIRLVMSLAPVSPIGDPCRVGRREL
jgi:hypothetical protein